MIKKFLIPLSVVAVSSLVAIWMFVQQPRPTAKEPEPPTMLVDVIRAQAESTIININAQGSVSPRTETTLLSEVSGMITEVSPAFQVGGFFRRGDVLVRIDDRNYRAEVKRAEAAVASQKLNLTQERGLADNAARDFENARSLFTTQAATDLALRKPQLEEARSNLAFAEADLARKIGDLERTTIRAPYDGLVREKHADLGQFVGAGTQLAVTFAVDVVEVRLPLPDRDLPFLELPDAISQIAETVLPAVRLTAAIGGRTYEWHGQIVRTEGVFDERSRVLYAVAQVQDPYNRLARTWDSPLRVGTFVEASIQGRPLSNVFILPRGVLRVGNHIWTVDEDDKLQRRDVVVAHSDENFVYVKSGLNDGELVTTTLVDNPLPGTRVRYEDAAQAPVHYAQQTPDPR